jgi:hypothetical protein
MERIRADGEALLPEGIYGRLIMSQIPQFLNVIALAFKWNLPSL